MSKGIAVPLALIIMKCLSYGKALKTSIPIKLKKMIMESIEEIEAFQKGIVLAADNGASPYYLTDLSDTIFDISTLVCNYSEKPTKRKQTRERMVNSLIGMLTEANDHLRLYIEDLKQAKCIEPFCLSSKQDDDDGGDNDQHLFWHYIGKLCDEIRHEETYQFLHSQIIQFNSLLAEAEDAKLNCDPVVFKEFFFRKKQDYNVKNVVRQFGKELYQKRPVTIDKLREMQVEAVLKALDKGIFDYAKVPSIQKVNKLMPELTSDILPCDFVMTDEFKQRYAKFRKYADKKGPMLVFNYELYGQYVVDNFNKFSKPQKQAIFELDVMLHLIHKEMMKERADTAVHADDRLVEPQESLQSDVDRFIDRVKAIFVKAAEKNGETITVNAKGWSGQYIFYVDADRISKILDDFRQNAKQKVKEYLDLFKGCTSVSAVAPFVGEILDIEELRVKELQKSDMKFAFEPFYGMSTTAVIRLSSKLGNTESEMLINTFKGLLRKYPKT